jgi:flagellin
MAIRINTNIFSLFVNRNLQRAGQRLDESMRRLSSGEKINRAGDDPAGLANSHALRAKISGLQRNLINGNEGLNLTNVAESALGNVSEILQRLRELAIQCSSDTISDSDRLLTQKEVDSLLAEIQRIATTSNYNGKQLLDGTFANLRLQVGTRMGQSIPVSIDDTRTSVLGSVARATGALRVDDQALAAGEITINGQAVPASTSDGISVVGDTASAIAKAAAINSIAHLTGVRAKADPCVTTAGSPVGAGSLDGTASALIINGTNIGAIDFLGGDSNQLLRQRINSYSTLTGVTASIGSSGELILTAADGRNVQIAASGDAVAQLGLPAGTTVSRGTLTLTSSNTIQVGGSALGRIGFTAGQATTLVDPATAIANLKVTSFDSAQAALDAIDAAMTQVLGRRSELGALQSRLNQTLDDVAVNIENLTGADSRLRDADFAAETARLTQAQIVQEAGVAILAQANVIPRMALNLLQQGQ